MYRTVLLPLLFATLLAPRPAAAQPDAPRVHTSYFKVDMADMAGWIERYQQREVPILEALVEDGVLLAYDLWVHNTGGEYDLRYNYVVPSFGAVAEIGAAFFERSDSATAAAFEMSVAAVDEMRDEIWYIGDSNLPDDRPLAPYVYESAFQIQMSELEQWNADFARISRPGLERAMDEGLISAWARLDHSIGGPWNRKIVYWLSSWDSADDLFELLARTAEESGAIIEGTTTVRRHTDTIWNPVPGRAR